MLSITYGGFLPLVNEMFELKLLQKTQFKGFEARKHPQKAWPVYVRPLQLDLPS